MNERQFIVTDRVRMDYPTYVALCGATYSEEHLREWANDRWGTPKDATLDVIARDVKQGGWILFEFIVSDKLESPDATCSYIYKCPKCKSTDVVTFSSGIIAMDWKDGKRVKLGVEDIHDTVQIKCNECKHSVDLQENKGDVTFYSPRE